jgi:hypothetical protein
MIPSYEDVRFTEQDIIDHDDMTYIFEKIQVSN